MEENNPLVSIVIPVHNGEKYIKEAIDSCLNQTYSNFEIIVVDDKSTDSTLNILKEYGNKILLIEAEKQNGLGNVINIGIRASEGEFIARMDADDVMCPDRIKKQVEYLLENPDCVVVGGQIDIIDSGSKITGHREYALEDKDIRRNMFIFQPFAHPAVMLRRSAVESIGLYPEDLWKVEDVKFFFLMSQEGLFANLPDTVLKYRMSFDTESQSKMVDHFRKTHDMRKWVVKNLGIRPSFRERAIWFLQRVVVLFVGFLPGKVFMRVYEFGRKVVK